MAALNGFTYYLHNEYKETLYHEKYEQGSFNMSMQGKCKNML